MEKLEYNRYNAIVKYEWVCNNTQSGGLLYYTNGSHEGFVKFCADEVFEDRGGIDMRRMRRGKSFKIGDAQGTLSKYQGDSSI